MPWNLKMFQACHKCLLFGPNKPTKNSQSVYWNIGQSVDTWAKREIRIKKFLFTSIASQVDQESILKLLCCEKIVWLSSIVIRNSSSSKTHTLHDWINQISTFRSSTSSSAEIIENTKIQAMIDDARVTIPKSAQLKMQKECTSASPHAKSERLNSS